MEATQVSPIKMATRRVWSWIDSYRWLIESYTANGWKDGGEWYFITLKSGHQIYGFDEEDNGGCCLDHDGFVSYDGWDITEAIPELIGTYFEFV
jgi:hypothetical protein